MLQGGVEEEVGLVGEGDVLLVIAQAFKDAEVNNGRWIDRSAVGTGCSTVSR